MKAKNFQLLFCCNLFQISPCQTKKNMVNFFRELRIRVRIKRLLVNTMAGAGLREVGVAKTHQDVVPV